VVSQGPGWWLASDSNWYPPELHPDFVETPTEVSVGVSDTGPGLSGWQPSEDNRYPPTAEATAESGLYHGLLIPTPRAESEMSAPSPPMATAPMSERDNSEARRPKKHRSPVVVLLILVALIGGGIVVYSITAGSASVVADSPNQVVALATTAVQNAGSVRVVTTIQVPGQTVTYVNDSASDSGQEVVTSSEGVRMTVLLVNGTVFLHANKAAMTTLFQSAGPIAENFANKWLSFPSGSKGYKSITQTLTLASFVKEVTPTNPIAKLPPSIVDGQSVVGLRGELPGQLPGTLYLSATGPPLPVEEVTHTSGGLTTAIFSHWGESVHLTPPTGAILGSAARLP
jgi:hypothetical protein